MLATALRATRSLIALILAITTTLAFIGADMHVEVQGYCDSADDYLLYVGASSMEMSSSGSPAPVPGTGFVALFSCHVSGEPLQYTVEMLDETYNRREHDGVAKLVDRPG